MFKFFDANDRFDAKLITIKPARITICSFDDDPDQTKNGEIDYMSKITYG